VARNNGLPEHIIRELKKKLITNKTKATQSTPLQKKVINGSLSLSTAHLCTRLPTYFAKQA
jgi:hypothetical protein